MSSRKKVADNLSPLANAYLLAGLAALVLFGLIFVRSAGRLALIPTLIGAAGLAFRWRSGALLFLASVAMSQLYLSWMRFRFSREVSMAPGIALGVTALVYVIAQYRLLGLTSGVFPAAPRSGDSPPPRPAVLGPQELVGTLFTALTATIAAFTLWAVSGKLPPPWQIADPLHWRLGVLAWVLLGGLMLAAAVFRLLAWKRLSRAEAALFLQDTLWHETRREQRRINRWRAWALRRR